MEIRNGDRDQAPPGDRPVHRHFDAAREALARGALDEAEAACTAALSHESDFLPVLELAGVVACRRGDLASGVARFRWLVELVPDDPGARYNLGNALLSAGRHAEAETMLATAHEHAPGNPEILVALGTARRHAGRLAEARAALERALARAPRHVAALNALGATLADAGEFEAAGAAFQRALAIEPRSGTLRCNAGQMLLETAHYAEAQEQFRMALTVSSRDAQARTGLAAALAGAGDDDEAIHHFRKALRHAPDHALALYGVVDCLRRRGRLAEAETALAERLAQHPGDPNARYLAATLAVRRGDDDRARALLEALAQAGVPEALGTRVHGELAAVRDRADDAAGAMAAAERANRSAAARWERRAPGPNAFRARVAAIAEAASAGVFDAVEPAPAEDRAPIFVVGFPASGTEQVAAVLDAHPALATAPPVPALHGIAGRLEREGAYPGALASLSDEHAAELRADYRAALAAAPRPGRGAPMPPDGRWVDALPFNLLDVALVRRLFGAAPFVLVTRDPRDVCVSCWLQVFDLNAATANFLSLENTVATYCEVMRTWQMLVERLAPPVFTVPWERLMEDPRGALGALCDDLGLAFDPALLDPGAAPPPSDREPGRWRRYARWLEPFEPALAPFVERWGVR